MKTIRFTAIFVIIAAMGIAGMVIFRQHTLICSLRESQRDLLARYQEVSATNARLLSIDAARKDEPIRKRQQDLEILSLRNQLTLARKQLAAVATENQTSKTHAVNEWAGYVTKEQIRYVGFGTPQDAFQSMRWAAASGDYTNWLASLAPRQQEEELANPRSVDQFQREMESAAKIVGMQILATKSVGSDRKELKVRLDTENSVAILVFPMIAIGSEWRLGDEIHSYTQAWDNPNSTQ
jgi:hypothetical protein